MTPQPNIKAAGRAAEPYTVTLILAGPAITTRYGWKPGKADVATARFAIREHALECFNALVAEHGDNPLAFVTVADNGQMITGFGDPSPEPCGPFDRRHPAQRMFTTSIRAGRKPLVIGSFAS